MMEINVMWQISGTWNYFLETIFPEKRFFFFFFCISSQGFDFLSNSLVLLCFPTNTLECYCEGTNVPCKSSFVSYGNYSDPHLHVHTSCLYRQRAIIPFNLCRKA